MLPAPRHILPPLARPMADADLRFGFVKMLSRLEQLMRAKGEPFRAQAYKKAQEELLGSTTPITSAEQLKHRPGIGPTMLKKFEEYSRTGKLAALEKPGDQALLDLTAVHGVGPKKATDLIAKGITTIAQLRAAQATELNKKQRTALEHHEDLQKRIPRAEIVQFEKALMKVWDTVVPAGATGAGRQTRATSTSSSRAARTTGGSTSGLWRR